MMLLQVPPPAPPPPPPLLGTTGTELLLFGLLVMAGVRSLAARGRDPRRFVAGMLVVVSLFYGLFPETSWVQRGAAQALMHTLAALQVGVMRLLGTDVTLQGVAVVGEIRFTLAQGCMGLTYLTMAVVAVALHPSMNGRRRLAGIAFLTAGMIVANLLRLMALYYLWAGTNYATFHAFHRVGGFVFALAAFGLYVGVLTATPRRLDPDAPAPSVQAIPAGS